MIEGGARNTEAALDRVDAFDLLFEDGVERSIDIGIVPRTAVEGIGG